MMKDIKIILKRLKYATQNVLNRSVTTVTRSEWEALVHPEGYVTNVQMLPKPFMNVMHEAQVVAVTASGIQNPDPGIDVVRLDEKDAPNIYNIDHYTVVQTFCLHPKYETIIKKAGVEDSQQLQDCLMQNVFVVKQKANKTKNHHEPEIPKHIRNARDENS